VGVAVGLAAQEERPQITPGERKVPRKKEAGPRALGLVRLTASGKATLVPIAILLSGKFYDASAYKASPIPMALDSGTVYEGEHTGTSLGLFTVSGALHRNVANAATPWIGTGQWLPAGAEVAKTTMKAEDVPVGIDTSDEPPRLSKSGSASKEAPPGSTGPPSATSPSTAPPTTAPPTTAPQDTSGGTSGGNSGSGPSGSAKPAPSSTAPPAGESKPAKADDHSADNRPDNHADDHAKPSDSNSGASDANRPRLRRGKPVEALPDEEVPGYSKPGKKPAASPTAPSTAASAANAGKPAEAESALVPLKLIPAISDASGPEPRSFAFEWLKSEEGERRQQMMALATEQLRAYLDAQAKGKITSKPSGPQAARHLLAKPGAPILENAQMVAYDLWTNNQPVMVFAADAHMPPAPAGSPQAAADAELQYSIMLVARTDMYNNLHKLYVGITDKYHLDLTPRLELIDAVDADGDGRGELLFRETSDVGSGWLVYRASPDKLWKLFDSLNPE
jgi:hypothetical protein